MEVHIPFAHGQHEWELSQADIVPHGKSVCSKYLPGWVLHCLRSKAGNQVPFRGIKELNSGLFALFLVNVHVYFMKFN